VKYHICPVHGKEECLMSTEAKFHGCREGVYLAFAGPTLEREFMVLRMIRSALGL
jgi:hypothetical protein